MRPKQSQGEQVHSSNLCVSCECQSKNAGSHKNQTERMRPPAQVGWPLPLSPQGSHNGPQIERPQCQGWRVWV